MEPEIASAPAPAAAPAAAPAPAEPAAAATPVPGPDRRARKDAIVQRVRDAQAKAAPAPAATTPVVPAKAPEPAPATVAPAPAPDPRLAALETEAAGLRTKLEEASKVKAAPKDVDGFVDYMEEAGFTMEQISELWLKRQDNPDHKVLSAAEKRLKAIEDKIAAGEKTQKEREDKTAAEASAAEGRKQIRGMLDGDKARWPRLTRDERNATEALSEAEGKAGDKARALIKAGGSWTEEVAKKLVMEALDEIEADRADRATRYAMPDIPARRTITATTGNTGTLPTPRPEPAEPLTREQKKAALLARVRAGQPKTT
jgi:hypothetical protein